LATFGDDERLRALRQRAEGRRQKEEERKEQVV
jgi:hypothetical protein